MLETGAVVLVLVHLRIMIICIQNRLLNTILLQHEFHQLILLLSAATKSNLFLSPTGIRFNLANKRHTLSIPDLYWNSYWVEVVWQQIVPDEIPDFLSA
jgi:hypothetical protein